MSVVSDNPKFYTDSTTNSNITINNCIFETNRKGIKIDGSNINITNNEFKRKSNVGGNLDFINFTKLEGTNNVTNNTFTDTEYSYGFDNCIKISSVNNLTGTLNISNNTVNNLRGSIYRQLDYNNTKDKISINIENNNITSKNNISPIYFEINNQSNLSMIDSMVVHNNTFINNSGKSKQYLGLVYLSKNILNSIANINLRNPNNKFNFNNNTVTSYTIRTKNFYGENGFNVKDELNVLITDNFNVRNEDYVLVSENPINTNHFRELYSIANVRIVNEFEYSRYLDFPTVIVNNQDFSLNYNIEVKDILFTQTSGIAYLYGVGTNGGVFRLTITVTDSSLRKITDFSSEPIQLELKLPNANKASTFNMYKLDVDGSIISPQPSGYPVSVTYDSLIDRFNTSLPSLSNYIILDDSPPEGAAGGDPHIRDIDNNNITLPKDWNKVRLYESKEDNIQIIGYCGKISMDLIKDMNKIALRGLNIIRRLNPLKDTYVYELTYFIRIQVFKDNKLIIDMDLIDGNYKNYDEETKVIENTYSHYGLYSFTYNKYLGKSRKFKSFWIPIKSGYVSIKTDKFWDELNEISLVFNDKNNINNYSGEWFKHNENNKLE